MTGILIFGSFLCAIFSLIIGIDNNNKLIDLERMYESLDKTSIKRTTQMTELQQRVMNLEKRYD